MALEDLKGVGKKTLGYLSKLNITTIGDLLTHFPKKYEDRRITRPLRECLENNEEKFPVEVKVLGYDYFYAKGQKTLKVVVTDGFLRANLVCFNRDFLKDLLEEEKEYIVFADFQYKYGELQAGKFEFVPKGSAGDSLNFLRIVPVYPLTDGLSQNFLRGIIYDTLFSIRFEESLPEKLIKKYNFISKKDAFRQIHFPHSFELLDKAIHRLKYYELFELESNVALKKFFFSKQRKQTYRQTNAGFVSQFIESLPFQLTEGQKNAFNEIKEDLYSSSPMHRLIQGDVGSGKTIVAILAMLTANENSYQSAIMTPTEVLAKQHYKTLSQLLSPLDIKVSLLTGGLKSSVRKNTLKSIKEGESHIIVGTQALYSDDVEYSSLGLVVIDEQHKFGVQERSKFVEKGESVDLIVMTATPIPRSLSLTVYGDLEISIIRDKPGQRGSIKSRCIFDDEKRQTMYDFIDKEIEKGRQGFIVCPLIEESEKIEAMSTAAIYDEITTALLPHRKTALLHGKHSPDEKEDIMDLFVKGDFDILVSTTVIEVGVDIPNATFMIVENADRFGLSQLHQLRGRIGRGEHDSYCFFTIPNKLSEDGRHRLRALMDHSDGFTLAEEDLKIRGPGEFLGTRQSGLDSLKLANLIDDEDILLKAKEDSFSLVSSDPYFEDDDHDVLAKTIYKNFIEKHRFLLTN